MINCNAYKRASSIEVDFRFRDICLEPISSPKISSKWRKCKRITSFIGKKVITFGIKISYRLNLIPNHTNFQLYHKFKKIIRKIIRVIPSIQPQINNEQKL